MKNKQRRINVTEVEVIDSRPIELEITRIKPNGAVRIEFSERLHGF